jgi:acyl-CoA dehydrogenase
MNFDFSEDQKMIQAQARELLAERSTFPKLRQAANAERGFDADLWREVAELGWLSLDVPEEYGGMGREGLERCVLSEELGRSLAPIPFASTSAVIDAVRLFGSDAQKARYLPGLASGEIRGALSLVEDPRLGGFAATFANGRLNGMVRPVQDVDVAGLLVLAARDADAGTAGLYLVDPDQAGVRRRPLKMFDRLRGHDEVTFEAARAERLGGDTAGDAAAAIAELAERCAVAIAFEQVGGSEACLEMAIAYVRERKTFGRVIGTYQAIQHRLADMFAEKELARSNAYAGAWGLTRPAEVRAATAAAARLSGTSAFDFAARENLQLHGGIGYTWEANCHFYFRRARLLAQCLGPTSRWVDRLVDSIETD